MRKENEIYCNRCGKKLQREGEIFQEDFLQIEKNWGYFSEKDMQHHRFDLCESCYDKMVSEFQIPIEIGEETELL